MAVTWRELQEHFEPSGAAGAADAAVPPAPASVAPQAPGSPEMARRKPPGMGMYEFMDDPTSGEFVPYEQEKPANLREAASTTLLEQMAAGVSERGVGRMMNIAGVPEAVEELRGGFYGEPTAPAHAPYERTPQPETFKGKLARGGGALLSDLPLFMTGGRIAGGAAGGLKSQALQRIIGGAGAFGPTEALNEMLRQIDEEGGIRDAERILVEMAKGTALGGALGATTHLVKGPIKQFLAEVGVLTGGGAALEGEVPKGEDFLLTAILIGTLKASGGITGKETPARLKSYVDSVKNTWRKGVDLAKRKNDIGLILENIKRSDPTIVSALAGWMKAAKRGTPEWLLLARDVVDPQLQLEWQAARRTLREAQQAGNVEEIGRAGRNLSRIEETAAAAIEAVRMEFMETVEKGRQREAEAGVGPTEERIRSMTELPQQPEPAPRGTFPQEGAGRGQGLMGEFQRLAAELRDGDPSPGQAAEIVRRQREIGRELDQVQPGWRAEMDAAGGAEGRVIGGEMRPPGVQPLGPGEMQREPGLVDEMGRPLPSARDAQIMEGAEQIGDAMDPAPGVAAERGRRMRGQAAEMAADQLRGEQEVRGGELMVPQLGTERAVMGRPQLPPAPGEDVSRRAAYGGEGRDVVAPGRRQPGMMVGDPRNEAIRQLLGVPADRQLPPNVIEETYRGLPGPQADALWQQGRTAGLPVEKPGRPVAELPGRPGHESPNRGPAEKWAQGVREGKRDAMGRKAGRMYLSDLGWSSKQIRGMGEKLAAELILKGRTPSDKVELAGKLQRGEPVGPTERKGKAPRKPPTEPEPTETRGRQLREIDEGDPLLERLRKLDLYMEREVREQGEASEVSQAEYDRLDSEIRRKYPDTDMEQLTEDISQASAAKIDAERTVTREKPKPAKEPKVPPDFGTWSKGMPVKHTYEPALSKGTVVEKIEGDNVTVRLGNWTGRYKARHLRRDDQVAWKKPVTPQVEPAKPPPAPAGIAGVKPGKPAAPAKPEPREFLLLGRHVPSRPSYKAKPESIKRTFVEMADQLRDAARRVDPSEMSPDVLRDHEARFRKEAGLIPKHTLTNAEWDAARRALVLARSAIARDMRGVATPGKTAPPPKPSPSTAKPTKPKPRVVAPAKPKAPAEPKPEEPAKEGKLPETLQATNAAISKLTKDYEAKNKRPYEYQNKPDYKRLQDHRDKLRAEANRTIVEAFEGELEKRAGKPITEPPEKRKAGKTIPAPFYKMLEEWPGSGIQINDAWRADVLMGRALIARPDLVNKTQGKAIGKAVKEGWIELREQGKVEPKWEDAPVIPKGEKAYFIKDPEFARELYRHHTIYGQAKTGVPLFSSERPTSDAPGWKSMEGEDARYGLGVTSEGEIRTGKVKGKGDWATNGHMAMRVNPSPPKKSGAAKQRFIDNEAANKKYGEDKKYPGIDNVIPVDPNVEVVPWAFQRAERGVAVVVLHGETKAGERVTASMSNDYFNLVEATWPGGKWKVEAPKKGDTADKPIAYQVDGETVAVVMPMHAGLDKPGALLSLKKSVMESVEAQTEIGKQEIQKLPVDWRSMGAARPVEFRERAVKRSKRAMAAAKAMGLKLGFEPKILTAAEKKALTKQLAVARAGKLTPVSKQIMSRMMASDRLEAQAAKVKKAKKVKAKAAAKPKAEKQVLTDAERGLLTRGGAKVRPEKVKLLGKRGLTRDQVNEFTPEEKVVHLIRDISTARHVRHMENIFTTDKYDVARMPREDLELLLQAAALRSPDLTGVPKALRKQVEAVAGPAMAGIATGKPLESGLPAKLVAGLAPARIAMRDVGILEDATTGIRGGYDAAKNEWNLLGRYGKNDIFRRTGGRRIRRGSRDAAVIHAILQNSDGHPKHINRPVVTMKDGSKVRPLGYHRRAAGMLKEILEDLRIRQGLPIEKSRKNYITNVAEPFMDLRPAGPQLLDRLHALAKEKLGGEYDLVEVEKLLHRKTLTRAKGLQIRDYLRSRGGATTLRRLRGRITSIMAVDDMAGVPKEVWQPYLKERKGGDYVEDAVLSYEMYVRYAVRKIHLEPAIDLARPIIEAMPEKGGALGGQYGLMTQRAYAERWIDHVLGRPAPADMMVHALQERLARSFGGNLLNVPVIRLIFTRGLATRASSFLTRLQYFRLLSMALDSSFTNLTQGANTMAAMGLMRTAKGYAGLLNPRNYAKIEGGRLRPGILLRQHMLREWQPFFGGARRFYEKPLTTFEKIALSPFTLAEFTNRGAAFLAAMSEAKSKGMSTERSVRLGLGAQSEWIKQFDPAEFKDNFFTSEAEWHARARVLETQFGYSAVESAPAFGTPGGRLALQFWNFPTQQSAFFLDGLRKARMTGHRMEGIRRLALLGFFITGAAVGRELFKVDMRNLFSIGGFIPRGLGPNVELAWNAWHAAFGDWTAKVKLQMDYGKTPVEWILPRAYKKVTGMTHKRLEGEDPAYRYLPFYPVQPEKIKSGRRDSRTSRSNRTNR